MVRYSNGEVPKGEVQMGRCPNGEAQMGRYQMGRCPNGEVSLPEGKVNTDHTYLAICIRNIQYLCNWWEFLTYRRCVFFSNVWTNDFLGLSCLYNFQKVQCLATAPLLDFAVLEVNVDYLSD